MDAMVEKMRKAREVRLPLGDIVLTILRPTDLDATEMRYSGTREAVKGVSRFVVGWDNVTELDLVPGGTDKEVHFNLAVFSLWIEDRPQYWEPLISGVLDAYKAHERKREADAKN